MSTQGETLVTLRLPHPKVARRKVAGDEAPVSEAPVNSHGGRAAGGRNFGNNFTHQASLNSGA